jgi:hypothetical protein
MVKFNDAQALPFNSGSRDVVASVLVLILAAPKEQAA